MIVCHCMNITDHDIRAAVDWMRAADTDTIVTPGSLWTPGCIDIGGNGPVF